MQRQCLWTHGLHPHCKGPWHHAPYLVQGNFLLVDCKSEENGVMEAASPYNKNENIVSYNALVGGMLTGKYADRPAAPDSAEQDAAIRAMRNPQGRMDKLGWSRTLYQYHTKAVQAAIGEYTNITRGVGCC